MLSKWKQVLIGDMKEFYQQFYDEFIPLFLAPTIEDLILSAGYENTEAFMTDYFAISFTNSMGQKQTNKYHYQDFIKDLNDFDTLEEVERFLLSKYEEIRIRIHRDKLQWLLNHD